MLKSKENVCASTTSDLTDERTVDWLFVDARILVGLAGVVACYAWLFLMLGTSAFLSTELTASYVGIDHLATVMGAACALFATWLLSDKLAACRVLQFSLAAVCTACGCAGLWFMRDAAMLVWLPALFLGGGFGFLYPLYGEYLCLFFYGRVRVYVYGILACSMIACGALLLTSVEMGFFFALVFPAVALVAYLLEMRFFGLRKRPFVDKKTSDARHRVVWRSYLATATSGMAAGYAIGCLLSTQVVRSWEYLVVEVGLVAACCFLLFDALSSSRINETVTMKFFLPCSAVIVFPLLFVPDDCKFVFALLLLCGSMLPNTCSLTAILKHIVICDLSAVRAFSFGRLVCFLGIAFGMIISFLGFSPAIQTLHGSGVAVASVVLFMVLVIFSTSFVMIEDNYPDERRFHAGAKEEGDAASFFAPGTPIHATEMQAKEAGAATSEQAPALRPGLFHVKCGIVAKKYGLSTRQREVLGMLAKGRNADYITEKLVISSHTAKAHIYNIYQKTGVHSRQELMDIVENTPVQAADIVDFVDPREG